MRARTATTPRPTISPRTSGRNSAVKRSASFSRSKPQPLRHLPARHCERREKSRLNAGYPLTKSATHLFDEDVLDRSGINPYTDVLSLSQYREAFGYEKAPFTGMDYVTYYEKLIEEEGAEAEIILRITPKRFFPIRRTCSAAISIRGAFPPPRDGRRCGKGLHALRYPERAGKRQRL